MVLDLFFTFQDAWFSILEKHSWVDLVRNWIWFYLNWWSGYLIIGPRMNIDQKLKLANTGFCHGTNVGAGSPSACPN
jgi:hypothetical protein